MELTIVLLAAVGVWSVVVLFALALCRAAARADAQAELLSRRVRAQRRTAPPALRGRALSGL